MQIHELIYWARPKKEDFEILAQRGFAIVQNFMPLLSKHNLGNLFYHKKGAEDFDDPPESLEEVKKGIGEFDNTMESFRKIMDDNQNREGGKIFHDLGHSFQLFTDISDEENMIDLSLSLGLYAPSFYTGNKLVVNFGEEIISRIGSRGMEELFKANIDLIKPYYAFCCNFFNCKPLESFWNKERGRPTTIHWLNYLDNKTADNIGLPRIKRSPLEEVSRFADGYYLKLNKEPIDYTSAADCAKQEKVNGVLRLG